jgi:hypothetical protein
MPVVETISIINKSGKVISTVSIVPIALLALADPSQTKHLVNIFKDAKEAYHDKKAEIRAEFLHKNEERVARKTLKNNRIEEAQSETSTRHSYRHRSQSRAIEAPTRPALTERNLAAVSEASVSSSRRGSRHGSARSPRSPHSPRSPVMYKAPYFENVDISRPDLARRHTDSLPLGVVTHRPIYAPPKRTMSSPILRDDDDMHLAYGEMPPDPHLQRSPTASKEAELKGLMSKLDKLMIEAHCIQHSAQTIIATLQANPEAMAAVALTLAEISNILSKMGPGVLAALKGGSPAIFALLASPQFLIAGGVAVGVTIVMFGGYKIIRKMQANAAEKKEASRMDEALVYEGDLGSIESWRRGIADEEARSVATSVDGEFITPEAAKRRRERIRERTKEERSRSIADSDQTIKRKEVPKSSTSRTVVSESTVRSERTARTESTVKPRKEIREKKPKKSSALTVLFKKSIKNEKEKVKSKSGESHKPKLLEI